MLNSDPLFATSRYAAAAKQVDDQDHERDDQQ
jgi:hypothetical protein